MSKVNFYTEFVATVNDHLSRR